MRGNDVAHVVAYGYISEVYEGVCWIMITCHTVRHRVIDALDLLYLH